MAGLFLTKGDITRTVTVDAIVTLVNPDGDWYGVGVDYAIRRVLGGFYYAQLNAVRIKSGLINGQVVIAEGSHTRHHGKFDHVVFVVDDLISPLNELVYSALRAAESKHFASVALPLMRTGVSLGEVEPDVKTVVQQMRLGIDRFLEDTGSKMDIGIVVYDNPEAIKMLATSMKLTGG